MIRVDQVRIGQRIDLEGDLYADPVAPGQNRASNHPEFEFEYEVVSGFTVESSECILLEFESGFACGFPPAHGLETDLGQTL